MSFSVDQTRILDLFLELVQIDAPSKREARLARFLKARLEALGLSVREDDSARITGSDTGNLIALLPGTKRGIRPIFFVAHMDTIESTEGVQPRIEGDTLLSSGSTILGADDRAGVAVVLEALRVIRELRVPHGQIEVIFTTAEETGLEGAKALDPAGLKARIGFVLDSGDLVGTAVYRAPAEFDFDVIIRGKAAHAGVEPEKGVSAISALVRALCRLPQGRVDPETTCNVGVISGGKATNIVPDLARVRGEVRSLDENRAYELSCLVEKTFEDEAAAIGARAEVKVTRAYPAFILKKEDPVVKLFARAAQSIGLKPALVPRGGGSDTNVLNSLGFSATNLGLGISSEHSVEERVTVNDLTKAAELVVAIILENAREGWSG